MGKRINKIAKAVSKIAGGESLVDYMGSKVAKYNLRGTDAQKYVTDTTSKKKAALSGLMVASTFAGGGGLAKGAVTKGVKSIKIPGQKTKIKVTDTTKAKRPKGKVLNKADKWTDWGNR